MRIIGALRGERQPERDLGLSLNEYIELVTFAQNNYLLTGTQTLVSGEETIDDFYVGRVRGAYKNNGIVFACIAARALLFSEARFQFQAFEKGRPGAYFGDTTLTPLEKPWPGGSTSKLLTRAELDVSLAGNFYVARRARNQLRILRPDWVTILVGSMSDPDVDANDIDAEVIGYLYHPGGRYAGRKPETLLASEVAHYAPFPDPEARFRGMSWLSPVLREIQADQSATRHKLKFFERGATPNMIVKFDPKVKPGDFTEWIKLFREEHEGVANAYKTLFLGGGSDATVVGANLRQIDFKTVQGAGETRICAAARVPPIIVGISEGLEAATYSNYGQARRAFADLTMRPHWRDFAAAMEVIITPPRSATRLWYDDRDIPFLQEDERDAADIVLVQSQAARLLIDGGFEPNSVIAALAAGDLALLSHTGLVSVQLQAPGTALTNGNGNGLDAVAEASKLLESIDRARRLRDQRALPSVSEHTEKED